MTQLNQKEKCCDNVDLGPNHDCLRQESWEEIAKKLIYDTADSLTDRDGNVDPIDSSNFQIGSGDLLDFIREVETKAFKAGRDAREKEIIGFIDKNYLAYCREHNGMPYCKNCGLDINELQK